MCVCEWMHACMLEARGHAGTCACPRACSQTEEWAPGCAQRRTFCVSVEAVFRRTCAHASEDIAAHGRPDTRMHINMRALTSLYSHVWTYARTLDSHAHTPACTYMRHRADSRPQADMLSCASAYIQTHLPAYAQTQSHACMHAHADIPAHAHF